MVSYGFRTFQVRNPNGCSDFTFFDRNTDDTIVLEIQGEGLAEQAHTNGEPLSLSYDLTERIEDLDIMVHFGIHLSHALCNDTPDPSIETIIDTTYIPVNGTLNLLITPNGTSEGMGDYPADIHIEIQNSDFCAALSDGSTHHENCFNVDSYSATASIGWLPG